MNNFKSQNVFVTSLAVLAISSLLSGCISLTGTSEVLTQGSSAAVKKNTSPFIEAYLDYGAVPAKWAGPSGFVVHVQAKDAAKPEFSVRHGMHPYVQPAKSPVEKVIQKVIQRTLASEGKKVAAHDSHEAHESHAPSPKKEEMAADQSGELISNYGLSLTTEGLRERLNTLGDLVADEEQNPEVKGCLSPLKVRLVRNDGSVLEKEGCRNALGWPGYVSQIVSGLISARTDVVALPVKAPNAAVRAPASVTEGKEISPGVAPEASHPASAVKSAPEHLESHPELHPATAPATHSKSSGEKGNPSVGLSHSLSLE